MILIDTSVWIDYLRATPGKAHDAVEKRLMSDLDQLAICEPIAYELLAGPTDERTVAKIEQLVNGLPTLGVDPVHDFRTAATIYRAARASGRTIRSLNDCLIAAVALSHDATLLHKDADFDVIASVTTLKAVSVG